MYLKRRGKVWVWAVLLATGCLVALLALPLGLSAQDRVLLEGGDAPSSHNHGGAAAAPWPAPIVMETYAGSGVQANFPVVWDFDGTLAPGPGGGAYLAGYYGFCHDTSFSFLGIGVNDELDADLLPDWDSVTNIDPPTNTANRDGRDDGVTIPTVLPHCGTATVTITGQNSTGEVDLNINAWFDWNRDGDWEDGSVCGCGDNEWAIQDQKVGPGPFTLNIPIVPCHPTVPYDPLWARVTLSYPQLSPLGPPYTYGGSPAAASSGEGCFDGGETEDYFVQPQQPAFELGDLVWYDTDQDGLQDAGEPGVPDVLAELYPSGTCTGPAMAAALTDASGNYDFSNFPVGTYCVEFSVFLPWWDITSQDQGADDTIDSDADAATAQIQNIVLVADDYDEDMGLYADGSIGDTVWCDSNGNGDYDAGEGMDDVTVWLYNDPDCDGDESDGVLLETRETAGGGQYAFIDLDTGPPFSTDEVCYVVVVDQADPDLGACDAPLTAVRFGYLLNGLDPDTSAADFGFIEEAVEAEFVPEPGSILLLGSGLAGLAGYATLRWRARE